MLMIIDALPPLIFRAIEHRACECKCGLILKLNFKGKSKVTSLWREGVVQTHRPPSLRTPTAQVLLPSPTITQILSPSLRFSPSLSTGSPFSIDTIPPHPASTLSNRGFGGGFSTSSGSTYSLLT